MDDRSDYSDLLNFMDWAFRVKQLACRDHKSFQKSWPVLAETLLVEHGWTLIEFDAEIDRQRLDHWNNGSKSVANGSKRK